MEIKNVTICGSGILGAQIAFQTAYYGYKVILYDLDSALIEKVKERLKVLAEDYKTDINATEQQIASTFEHLSFATELDMATQDADLVIEAIPENLTIKREFYQKLAKVAPEKSIFCTNTSTLLPSQFAQDTGRPEKFLALHFSNQIHKWNTAEIMGHAQTDPSNFKQIIEFAKSIGMVTLPLQKEHPGYIINNLLPIWLDAAVGVLMDEVADVHTIDKTWMIATGSPVGPFMMLDIVGLNTAYQVTRNKAEKGNEDAVTKAKYLKENFIDQGKLGKSSGKGFYDYPNPAFANADFLK